MPAFPFPLMIFAAGFGTRMGALTADRPKPLIPVAGRALIDHALDQAAGVARIVVNTHYLGDQRIWPGGPCGSAPSQRSWRPAAV